MSLLREAFRPRVSATEEYRLLLRAIIEDLRIVDFAAVRTAAASMRSTVQRLEARR